MQILIMMQTQQRTAYSIREMGKEKCIHRRGDLQILSIKFKKYGEINFIDGRNRKKFNF